MPLPQLVGVTPPPVEGGDIEVIYQPPPGGRGTAGAIAAALALTVGVFWIVGRVLRGPLGVVLAVGLCLGLLALGAVLRREKVLRPRRVTADRSRGVVQIEHRGGVLRLAFGELASVQPVTRVMGDGIALDTVTLTLGDGRTVAFSVMDAAAAEGAARALRVVTGLDIPQQEEAPETAPTDQGSEGSQGS